MVIVGGLMEKNMDYLEVMKKVKIEPNLQIDYPTLEFLGI